MTWPARFARCLVRTGFNIGGCAFILVLTAADFDATELAALAFLSCWFIVVEAATLMAKVEPSNIDRRYALCPIVLVAAVGVSVSERTEPKAEIVVAASCLPDYPRACVAVQRLRDRGF